MLLAGPSNPDANEEEDEPLWSIRCQNKDGHPPQKRRVVVSNKTNALVKANGKKLEVEYSSFHKGPKRRDTYNLIVRDIGAAVRAHVPMLGSTYNQLEDHHKDALICYLENMYNIPQSDLAMWNFVHKRATLMYSNWKYKCRKHYLEHGPNKVPFEFKLHPDEWRSLVKNEFEDEAKKVVCARNQANRTKNPSRLNHHSGLRPVSHRAEDWMTKGHLAPFVHAALDIYLPCKNETEQVQRLKRRCEEIMQAQEGSSEDQAEPLSVEDQCEILSECLGERKGTEVRGMGGAGRRPTKKQGGPMTAEAAEKRRELEERAKKAETDMQQAREEAQRAKEEAEKAKEEAEKENEKAKQADEKSDRVLDENALLKERMAALEASMLNTN